jgi:parallel beta-helix repeat protein
MVIARKKEHGAFGELESLIAAAKSGSTIRLSGKRYVLDAPLLIDKPLTIRGAGPKTAIVGKTGRAVVIVRKKTRLRLERLSILREGKAPGHVVMCRARSVVTLSSCVVRGGKGKKGSMSIGVGVCTDGGDVDLTIQDCTLLDHDLVAVHIAKRSRLRAVRNTVRNGLAAFYIADDAHADLEANTCSSSKTASIFFMDRSKGTARNNKCLKAQNAFYISGKSTPRIERNVCDGMTLVGIWIGGHSSPTISSNRITNSKSVGISIQQHAKVTISNNDVSGAKLCGISFSDNTRGTVERNRVSGCKQHGILLSGRSAPTVSRNQCTKNTWSGLVVAVAQSTPKIIQNTCNENGENGIVVIDAARPRIEKNVARENEDHGLWTCGRAQPTVTGNTFERNRRCGIVIAEKSAGLYQANRMIENERHGVLIEDSASPKLLKNTCEQNGQAGILVTDKALPTLEQNVLARNTDAGIEYWNRAGGTAMKNICRKNEDSGIRLIGDVSPTLTSNQCIENDGNGISLDEDTDDVRPTKAKLRGNITRGNAEDDDESGGIGTHASWALLKKRVARTPLKDFARQMWKPLTKAGDGSVVASKFGGTPYLEADETWPCCGNCKNPMPLIIQLDLAHLPKAAAAQCGGRGLLQFFFCRNRTANCSDYGEASHLVRVLSSPKVPRNAKAAKAPKKIEGSFSPKVIEGWRDQGEMIRWLELRDAQRASLTRNLTRLGFTYFDGDDDVGEGPHVDPVLGDKLLGWPCWIQDATRMSCARPKCTKPMRHLFQIDSEDNVPWMWGDSGTAWLFQCPTHRDSVALEWQCH